MNDLEDLVLPSDASALKVLLSLAIQRGYEACVLDLTDAAMERAGQWHEEDCPVVDFLRLLRNNETLAQEFIAQCRRRREGT